MLNSDMNFPSPEAVSFPVGAKQGRSGRIFPVFLPFAGCPGQCVYCAQDRQTGRKACPSVATLLESAEADLLAMPPAPRELAFYGGTFTALPEADREACLAFLGRMRAQGRVSQARCSTRPDALSPGVLDTLSKAGIDLVELGIQSFSSHALAASRRGYDREAALRGCHAVRGAGLELGIQLLPGMPGCGPDTFLDDAEAALSLRPACLRFYPCLVPEGTVLARWWREGSYEPWGMEDTVDALGRALARAWEEGVPVIRLSVAPEPAFDAAVVAGPRHPALGALIQAEALLRTVAKAAAKLGRTPTALRLPRACQGFLYGDRGALKPRWAALGLTPERISFTSESEGVLQG